MWESLNFGVSLMQSHIWCRHPGTSCCPSVVTALRAQMLKHIHPNAEKIHNKNVCVHIAWRKGFFQLLRNSEKLTLLPCCFFSTGSSPVCTGVCVVLYWWSLKPWRSTHMAVCLPSSPLFLKHCCCAAFKLTVSALKCCVNSFFSWLLQFICIQPLWLLQFSASCWLIAFVGIQRLVPEQPNKSVIDFRAVCSAAEAKQSTALCFMASTLE